MEKIALHPLVVMNMSDHFTRARYRNKVSKIKVIGLILGNQIGSILEISNSIEMKREEATGEPDVKYA
jgi:COP9 signalosome complex subunit 6